MSLVQRLVDDSAGDSVSLSSLLRRARVLAHKLDSHELDEWANRELEGYRGDSAVPDYRKTIARNVGQFSGPFGAAIENAPLPMALLPESVRDVYETFEAREGVRVYENYFGDDDNSVMALQWDPLAVVVVQRSHPIYEGYVLATARQEIAKPFFVGILDTVRNRLLSLALELQARHPTVSESDEALLGIPKPSAASIVQVTIHGGQQNIATGDNPTQTAVQEVVPHNLESLLGRLRQLGVPEGELDGLVGAIEEDAEREGGFGQAVEGWLGAATANAVGSAAGQAMLMSLPAIAAALHRFFG